MSNYDDMLNDHEYRIEELENGGGGGSSTADSVLYNDSSTKYGSSNVQGVLEKIKSIFDSFVAIASGTITLGDASKNLNLKAGDGTDQQMAVLTSTSLRPSADSKDSLNLGLANYRYNNVYSNSGNFSGDVVVSGTINGRLNGLASGNALPISVYSASSEATNINAGANATIQFDVSRRGSEVLGIVGYELSGTGTGNCTPFRIVPGATAEFRIHNNGSSAATCTVKAYVLYQQSAIISIIEE